jgi:hypothetical protein
MVGDGVNDAPALATFGVRRREERSVRLLREPQCALPSLVIDHQEKIYFARRGLAAVLSCVRSAA